MNYEEKIAKIKQTYDHAPNIYKQLLKKYTEVENWIYASWDLYQIEPYFSERNKFPKGRKLSDKNPNYQAKHGIDKHGKCLITSEPVEFPGEYYETFFQYSKHSITSYRFSYNKEKDVVSVTNYILANDKVAKVLTWGSGGNSIKDYYYNNKIVTHEILKHPKTSIDFSEIQERRIDYKHDTRGLLSIKEDNYYWYYRLNKREFDSLKEKAKRQLIDAIMTSFKKINEPIFKIALMYEKGFCFPPEIVIGTEKGSSMADSSKEEYKNSPSDWKKNIKYDFDKYLMQKLNNISEISSARFRQLEQLMAEIATDLNIRINEAINENMLSKDFIVVHSDFDGTNIKKNEDKIRKILSSR